MNKIKKHIVGFFSIILSLVVLMTTSGFSIYVHHCNHNQADYYSLFVPSQDCNMHAPKPVVKSCCQNKEITVTPPCNETNNNGCCTDKIQVVKLDTKTLVDNTIPTIKPIETINFVMLMAFHTHHLEANNPAVLANPFADSPPPLTTTEYLSRIQVYLI